MIQPIKFSMRYVTQGAGGSEFVKGVTLGGGGLKSLKKLLRNL